MRYLGSQFLGHAAAKDLVNNFLKVSRNLNLRKMIQVSMNGSSVNWSVLDMLKGKLERELDNSILMDLEAVDYMKSMVPFKLLPELVDLK